MDPRDEARRPAAHELFALDAVDARHELAVAVTVSFTDGRAACSMCVAGRGRPLVVLVEADAGTPRGLELRAPGLWADLQCLVPFDHVTLDVEAFALALDDPADARGDPRGVRVPFGLELEWDTAPGAVPGRPATAADAAGYELACGVHGLVLVGDERLELVGHGSRRHLWGPNPPWCVPAARTVTTAGVHDGVPAQAVPLAVAPLRLVPADGRPALAMDRALVLVQDPVPSLAWTERNLPC